MRGAAGREQPKWKGRDPLNNGRKKSDSLLKRIMNTLKR